LIDQQRPDNQGRVAPGSSGGLMGVVRGRIEIVARGEQSARNATPGRSNSGSSGIHSKEPGSVQALSAGR
jgi:hypothetical protein